jgi:hypothetical protein
MFSRETATLSVYNNNRLEERERERERERKEYSIVEE